MGRRIRYRPVATPTEEQRQNDTFFTTQTIIAIAVIWTLVLVVIVGVVYFLRSSRNFQTEFEPLLAVCRGSWVSESPLYASNPGLHPAVAVKNSSGETWLDTSFIPRAARSQSLAETELVLCMEEAELVLLESCPYTTWTDRGGQIVHRIDRYYYVQDAKLMAAKTGHTIAVNTFTGRAPRECGDTEIFNADEPVSRLEGPLISITSVQQWLQPHLIIE